MEQLQDSLMATNNSSCILSACHTQLAAWLHGISVCHPWMNGTK